jgi:hypothetical protein
MNARNEEEISLYLRSMTSALLTGFILAIIEIFLSPWRYFPENLFYIDLYIFRYNLHLYDIFFTPSLSTRLLLGIPEERKADGEPGKGNIQHNALNGDGGGFLLLP